MDFEFDPSKSEINKRKHGVGLDEATRIWSAVHLEVMARTANEPRFMAIGTISGKLYACIYTVRRQSVRFISCRRAREKEAHLYHDHLKEARGET